MDWHSVLLGLFGGAGAIVFWEAFLRPLQRRRSVADALSAEIGLNMQLLGALKSLTKPGRIPDGGDMSTLVYRSVLAEVGDLKPKQVLPVIVVYRCFESLNALGEEAKRLQIERDTEPPDSPRRKRHDEQVLELSEHFFAVVESAVDRTNEIQPLLLREAYPWWSSRRWSRPDSYEMDMQLVAERLKASEALDEARRRRF